MYPVEGWIGRKLGGFIYQYINVFVARMHFQVDKQIEGGGLTEA